MANTSENKRYGFLGKAVEENETIEFKSSFNIATIETLTAFANTKGGSVNGTVNGTVNAQKLSDLLGVSLRTIKRELYALQDLGLIQHIGSDKTGHWEIIKKEN